MLVAGDRMTLTGGNPGRKPAASGTAWVPEGVAVNRIRIHRVGDPESQDLRLFLDGVYTGEQASGVFHQWMDRLKAESPLGGVENLRFERKGTQIAFHLEGTTNEKGSTP